MNRNSAVIGMYQGENAVWLKSGKYEGVMLHERGGNLIAFRDTETGSRFLHEPAGMEACKKNPYIYGIPVLIPPNRYKDGRMSWQGRELSLPVNESKTGNHLHGFVHSIPWSLDGCGATDTESWVTVSLKVTPGHPVFSEYPFSFTVRLSYTLSEFGLRQQVFVRNDGEMEMPHLLAFHTTLNAPFHPAGSAESCLLKMTMGERWELSERMLPTGSFQALTPEEEQMKSEGVNPFFAPMDNHYTAVPQNGSNRIELSDRQAGQKLIYDAGTSYRQWMIWNNEAAEGFFCPEPQINLVNAPNVCMDSEAIGLVALKPGEIWEETSRLYVLDL